MKTMFKIYFKATLKNNIKNFVLYTYMHNALIVCIYNINFFQYSHRVHKPSFFSLATKWGETHKEKWCLCKFGTLLDNNLHSFLLYLFSFLEVVILSIWSN